jgi:Type II CAAX prenyl endopeptidase Rce1-like
VGEIRKADDGLGSMLRRYAQESRSLGNSALLTAPIVLLYEVGLIVLGDRGVRNAADALIDRGLMALGRPTALLVNLLVLGAFVAFALRSSRRKATPIGLFIPVILESAAYAALLAPALMTIARRMMSAPPARGALEGVVLALGAGFYEELVFRLAAIGGVLVVLDRGLGLRNGWIVAALLVLAGIGFSAFHHVGAGGEPLDLGDPQSRAVFVMRSVAGVLLGSLFILRGFGIACYTHVIYDLLCLR